MSVDECVETLEDQFSFDDGRQTISFPDETDSDAFSKRVLPFTLGYVSRTHGLVGASWTEKTITVAPLAE